MSCKNLILKLSCILFCAAFFLIATASNAHADSIILKVSPSVLRIEAKPPADVWTPFVIENLSNQPVSLKIGYKAFNPQLSSNGTVVFMSTSQQTSGIDKNIFDKMQIVDNNNVSHDSIELGPQQQQRFRLRILLPQNEPISDYYFSLIFLQNINQPDQNNSNSNTEQQKSFSTIQGGIGLNVLLAVGDKESPSGIIQTFSAPVFSNGGPIPISLKVSNTGNHFIVPSGQITIKDMLGETVDKINVPSSVVLAGTTRSFGNAQMNNNNSVGLEEAFILPQKILIGVYTATLTLNMSPSGPVYLRTIKFFSFPIVTLVEIIIILGVVLYIYSRVKKKL